MTNIFYYDFGENIRNISKLLQTGKLVYANMTPNDSEEPFSFSTWQEPGLIGYHFIILDKVHLLSLYTVYRKPVFYTWINRMTYFHSSFSKDSNVLHFLDANTHAKTKRKVAFSLK